ELAGQETFDRLAVIRRLARERRGGEHAAEQPLAERIESLDPATARDVVQAMTIYFDLVNIAEDRQRVRVLRDRERTSFPEPLGESLAAGLKELRQLGLGPAEVQQALDRLAIELVFTAHPSEAKRRSIRARLRRMRACLKRLDTADILPREKATLESELRSELAILWQSDFLRPSRPTVLDEVERGLSIMPRLWSAVTDVYAALRRGLAATFPEAHFTIPRFLSFGSWMGGDRDGNPFVTAEITEQTLIRLRRAAIDTHLQWCRRLHDMLTISLKSAPGAHELLARLEELRQQWPQLDRTESTIPPNEAYRQWLRMIRLRLEASRADSLNEPLSPLAYTDLADFEADVARIVDGLDRDHGLSLDAPARQWLDLVRTFGLHMTRLDIRQDARRYEEILGDIFAAIGRLPEKAAYAALPDADRSRLLIETMGSVGDLPTETLDPLTSDTLQLFATLQRASVRFGAGCLGGSIISLTRTPADVLAVLWLWRWAVGRAEAQGEPVSDHTIAIVPLFEKIGDLAHAEETLAENPG
ncbi:MAG: phosphoenolpyruvate carboxylase, partial [Planctomycetia bacterium]|nr:phosphoenolpyruvate carboxylase [Planctomycetia bacterium]